MREKPSAYYTGTAGLDNKHSSGMENRVIADHHRWVKVDRDIEYIIAVSECRSTHKAAERLYISQPALSRYISRIEQDLGVVLFCRRSYGMELTEAGKLYVSYAKEIKSLRSSMEKELRQFMGRKRQD